jgi:DNA-binding XRE family transcriptional regulator
MNKTAVIHVIQWRYRRGLPLDYASVMLDDEPLANTATRIFGLWANALLAAGIDPNTYEEIEPVKVDSPKPEWTRERVSGILRRGLAQGIPVSALLHTMPGGFRLAVTEYFGDADAIYETFGVEKPSKKENLQCRLQEIREAKGLSKSELGRRVGVSDLQIRRYETGEQIPRLSIAIRISEALGVSVNHIWHTSQ